jgi:hypothetical protein
VLSLEPIEGTACACTPWLVVVGTVVSIGPALMSSADSVGRAPEQAAHVRTMTTADAIARRLPGRRRRGRPRVGRSTTPDGFVVGRAVTGQ